MKVTTPQPSPPHSPGTSTLPTPRPWYRRLLWPLLGLLAVGLLCGSVYVSRIATLQLSPAAQSMVGTWRGEHEYPGRGHVIWDLRADGTARFRMSSGESLGSAGNTIGYLEWRVENGELITYQFSSKRAAWTRHLLSPFIGRDHYSGRESMQLIDVAEDHFRYEATHPDPTTGEELTISGGFRRTTDETIQAAP